MKRGFLFLILFFICTTAHARTIDTLIIHHTASGEVSKATITKWHKQRGFKTIGYHYIIHQNGTIEQGRPEEQVGAHAKNRNKKSIGIVLIGYNTFTKAQKESLFNLCLALSRKYNISKIERHHQQCPSKGIDVERLAFNISSIKQNGSCHEYYGKATYYRDWKTANGENMYMNWFGKTCASWFYPIGTMLKVSNLSNSKSVIVRVNDRGPNNRLVKKGRIIDLSPQAFKCIADLKEGIISVAIDKI